MVAVLWVAVICETMVFIDTFIIVQPGRFFACAAGSFRTGSVQELHMLLEVVSKCSFSM